MAGRKEFDPSEPPPSADELRMKLIDDQMAEMKKRESARTKAQKELEDFTSSFLKEEVTFLTPPHLGVRTAEDVAIVM